MSKRGFSEYEEARLRALYPTYPKRDVMAALPGHSWGSIQQVAAKRKIRRLHVQGHRSKDLSAHPASPGVPLSIRQELRAARIAAHMCARELSKKIGYEKESVGRWERGANRPGLLPFLDWVTALGYELEVVKKIAPSMRSRNRVGGGGVSALIRNAA